MTLRPDTVWQLVHGQHRAWRSGWRPIIPCGSRLVAIHETRPT